MKTLGRDISDNEIVGLVLEEANGDEEEEQETSSSVSHSQACQALEIVLSYVSDQPDVPMSTSVLLNGLLMQTSRKRASSLRQKRIEDYF